jgi:multidrug efflux pump subunit AcrB
MEKPEDVEILPLKSVNPLVNLMVRDVATVRRGVRPGELDRDMSQRYLTLTAKVEGEDMGRAARQVHRAILAAGDAPRGVRVEEMGQLPVMVEMFKALGVGLAVAVFVILVLLTAYLQSPRLAVIAVAAVPGVLAGIAVILFATGTSLNIESFMGSPNSVYYDPHLYARLDEEEVTPSDDYPAAHPSPDGHGHATNGSQAPVFAPRSGGG